MRAACISAAVSILDRPCHLGGLEPLLSGGLPLRQRRITVRRVDCRPAFVPSVRSIAGYSNGATTICGFLERRCRGNAAVVLCGNSSCSLIASPIGGLRKIGFKRHVATHGTGKEGSGATEIQGGSGDFIREQLATIETNLDDLNPQVLAYATERLFQQGALDVWVVQALMKKGRPASILNVLCRTEEADKLLRVIFQETSSLGARVRACERVSLPRAWERVDTPWGPVRLKQGYMDESLVNSHPEYEDCAMIARTHGVPIQVVMDTVKHLYASQKDFFEENRQL
eukprot:jgi/Mesvir1/29475/Mv23046-RA.1